jgi:hypothetical protein
MVGEEGVLHQIRPVDEDKDQVEAGEECGAQTQVLRHRLGAVVVAAHGICRRYDGSSEIKDYILAVPGTNPAISPAYSGLPVLRWAAIWDSTSL